MAEMGYCVEWGKECSSSSALKAVIYQLEVCSRGSFRQEQGFQLDGRMLGNYGYSLQVAKAYYPSSVQTLTQPLSAPT